uniref:Uncharacterized protein n=1 Tax=Anguilla anguilla TaxID=7936 RepID=A0A0E9WCL1_ANGAN
MAPSDMLTIPRHLEVPIFVFTRPGPLTNHKTNHVRRPFSDNALAGNDYHTGNYPDLQLSFQENIRLKVIRILSIDYTLFS